MRNRQRMHARKDKRVFAKTAARTQKKNIPGRIVTRGGVCL